MHIIFCFSLRPMYDNAVVCMCNLTLFWLLTWILILLGWFFLQYKLSDFFCICISLSWHLSLVLLESWKMLQDKHFHVSICAAALVSRFTAFIKSVPFCKVWMFGSLVMFTLYLTLCQISFGPPSKTCFSRIIFHLSTTLYRLYHSKMGLFKSELKRSRICHATEEGCW